MIVGNGNIARCLTDREGAIFFASGVSNSQGRDYVQFHIELGLILEHGLTDSCFFYFSSYQLNFEQPREGWLPYFHHKLKIENFIRDNFKNYVILRIGNLIGDTNPNTFVNYLRAHPEAEIKDEYRYMIDGATLNTLCQTLPLDQKIELSVATKIAKVKDLI